MKTTPLIFLVLFLSGCAAGGHLENPKVTTKAQLDADTHACQYEVDKAAASTSGNDPIGEGLRDGHLYNECMYEKGYRLVK